MRFNNVLGIDPGYSNHPSAFVLVRVLSTHFILRHGRIHDPTDGEEIPMADGMSAGEYAQPTYQVVDVQRRRAITFAQTAREVAAIADDHHGDLVVACDATGLGVGAVEALRAAGLYTVAAYLTSGAKVTGGRLRMNVPVSVLFSTIYKAMAGSRLEIAADGGHILADELMAMSATTTDTGHTRFEVGGGMDGHGDAAFALGIALVVAERKGRFAQLAMAAARQGQPRERPHSANRLGRDTARRVVKQRLQEAEDVWRRSAGELWAPLGIDPRSEDFG